MILNDGDNQNKNYETMNYVLNYESYPSCIAAWSIFFLAIVTIFVNLMQNLYICVWLHGTFSQNIV